MAAKTKEVDKLLNEIVKDLKTGKLPSVENSVALEALQWNYKEATKKNIATDMGLRTRMEANQSNDYKLIPQEFLTALLHQSSIDGFDIDSYINTIEAYLSRKITVAQLFGEKYRKQRNDVPWQEYSFYAFLVEKARTVIDELSSTHDENSISNSLFQLLEDITNEKLSEHEILDRHTNINEDQLKMLIILISEEIDSGYLQKGLITRGTFQAAYRKIK